MNSTQQKIAYRRRLLGLCTGGALVIGIPLASPGTLFAADASRLNKIEQENSMLRQRLDALEQVAQKEGIIAETSGGAKALRVLSDTTLTGFVAASYFYDFSRPDDRDPNGYLWTPHNSFTLNKVKVTLTRPAETSGDKWDAGYRASLIWGQDAPVVNTGGEMQGLEAVREAYAELNVPVGTGLNIKAGQLISLLNFESGDGGAANPNFSQGNQWFFTGNGPSTGVQAGYAFNEVFDMRVRVQNGLYTGVLDNNSYKTVVGSLGIKPDARTSINLIGFGGREGSASDLWLKGGSLIVARQLTDAYNLNVATELDYFHLDTPTGGSEWWSAGGWIWADFTPQLGLAVRGDVVSDPDGAGTSGLLGFPTHGGQDLYSVTLTLNWRPVPSIKVQPEVRYDHTTLTGGFDGSRSRFIAGMGVSYLF